MPGQFKKVYSSFLDFLKHPVKNIPAESTFKERFKTFIPLFILDILLVLCWLLVMKVLRIPELVGAENYRFFQILKTANLWMIFVLMVLAVPLIEELIFRFSLRLNENKIQINVIILLSGIILILVQLLKNNYVRISILSLGMIFLVFYLFRRVKINQLISSFWERKFILVFYVSAACFGLLHITNYNPGLFTYLFLPVLILPQLILGLFCGFIRLKANFTWGLVFHASHNLFFVLPLVVTSLISIPYKNSVSIVEYDNLNKMNYSRITNDTIVFDRQTIYHIIPELLDVKRDFFGITEYNIEYEDPKIADKILTVKYVRNKKKSSGVFKSSKAIVLARILEEYDLGIEKTILERDIYLLRIIYPEKLNSYRSAGVDTLKTKFPPVFYDKATLHNASPEMIARTIEINYNIEVVDSSLNTGKFTIEIPKTGFEELNYYMEEQYGIKLKESIKEVSGYRIKNAR